MLIKLRKQAPSFRAAVGLSGDFDHRFGHDPRVTGLIPLGQGVPAHLVLSLDMNDPRLAPFELRVGPRLLL